MNVSTTTTKENNVQRGYIYRQVFNSNFSSFVVFILLLSFVLQPIERANANEDVPSTDSAPAVVETETPVASDLAVSDADALLETETTESVTDPDSSPESVPSSDTTIEVATEDASVVVPVETELGSTTTDGADAEQTEVVDETVSESLITDTIEEFTPSDTPDTLGVSTEDAAGNITDPDIAPEIIPSPELEPTATSTVVGESAVAVSTVSSDGMIQFDKSDCVTVADGSFYCQPKKSAEELADDGLYALPDRDGDLEIYIQTAGEMEQITFNEIDDAAPYFDTLSNTIVWHRLLDDRYQIVSFDVTTGEEILLTSDTVNNMEPTRAGKYTVWQRWSGDNWDIVLYDGKNSTILTTALEHDIAPKVRGSLVVWNRLSFDRTQTVELYDIETGEYTSISDREGGTISNPRMVLVYESTFENGDIITKGYDIETGEITPLTATPVEIPDELPTPDSTGETRALIQGKSTSREDVENGDIATTTSGVGPEPDTSASSTEIIAPAQSPVTIFASTTTAAETLTLDLRPEVATDTPLVPDVIVPIFTPAETLPETGVE